MSESNFPQNNPPVAELADQSESFNSKSNSSSGCWLPCLLITGFFAVVIIGGGAAIYSFLAPDIEVVSEQEAAIRFEEKYNAIRTVFSGDYISDVQQDKETKRDLSTLR